MAKAQGIIGNFKGKIGNTVGYQLTSSNNKQTQGIRIYQPNVKNPKTSAQAEQRAKLAPINVTYRALKMVIDRGNEGLPYGNKSRLAWLKQAFKAEKMPWFEKGAVIYAPVGCQLTKGSLSSLLYGATSDTIDIDVTDLEASADVTTIGKISTILLAAYPMLKDGDQLTFVFITATSTTMESSVVSFVIDTTSTVAVDTIFASVTAGSGKISFEGVVTADAGAVIVSREGDNGQHLRSTEFIKFANGVTNTAPYDADSKTAAIESYMASGAANTDWAEESIQ